MALSLQTDYSLRTLMYLATTKERARISEVAEFFKISEAHVAKVVHHLARLGFIRSVRGVGGGMELAKRPDEITVADVLLAVEGPMHLLDCVVVEDLCVIQQGCKLRHVLAEAERRQLEYLQSVKLSDVIPIQMTRDEERLVPLRMPLGDAANQGKHC